jgi:RNA polymerase sigma factor (sigma-70 family)
MRHADYGDREHWAKDPFERPAPEREAERFGSADAAAIEQHTTRQRALDRQLAEDLDEPKPDLAPVTSSYLRELDRRPRLSAAREDELLLVAKSGDRAARAQLIETYLPLIASVARMYRSSSRVERVELLQEGVVGLLRALERYEPARGVPFWAYATWWVRHAMQQIVAELTRPVVLSDRALRQLARVKDAHGSYLQAHGREPSRDELAEGAELSPEQVADLVATDRPPLGLDEPVLSDDQNSGTFGDLLVDPLAEDEYERVLLGIEIEQLRSLLTGLSDRERAIVRSRYNLDDQGERTLQEIAGELGVSAERVRQIEQRALGKLRSAVGEDQ